MNGDDGALVRDASADGQVALGIRLRGLILSGERYLLLPHRRLLHGDIDSKAAYGVGHRVTGLGHGSWRSSRKQDAGMLDVDVPTIVKCWQDASLCQGS